MSGVAEVPKPASVLAKASASHDPVHTRPGRHRALDRRSLLRRLKRLATQARTGYSLAPAGLDRLGLTLACISSAWLLVVGLWEICAPYGAGHAALAPARGMIAENMLEHGVVGPVRTYTVGPPGPEDYYANHPWGSFWLQALMLAVFGRHEATFRLLPVLMTAVTPWLLYRLGRALYGPVAGGLAALGYAVMPIVLGFANFPGFEIPVVFGCVLTAWTTVRLLQTGRRRWLVFSTLALLWGYHSDWPYYIFALVLFGWLVLAHLALPRAWFAPVPRSQAWLLSGIALGLAVFTLALYAWLFEPAGGVEALLAQGRFRAGAHTLPLSEVLERRAYWIEVMFTPPAILLGKLMLFVFVLRLFLLRRGADIVPIAIFLMATVHYVVFENGASVHIYWPLPYAAYFALSLGLLGHLLAPLSTTAARLLGRRLSLRRAWRLALVVAAVLPLAILPDAVSALDYARRTGLRLNDDGHLNLQDFDKARAIEFLRERIPEGQLVNLHPSMFPNWAQEWLLHRPTRVTARAPHRGPPDQRFALLDTRFSSSSELHHHARAFAVTAVGPFWLVDAAGTPGTLSAFGLRTREPTLWERALVQAHDPIYSVAEDAWQQWEWRVHFGRAQAPPTTTPDTPDQLRIAHNAAVAAGAAQSAASFAARLLEGCRHDVHTRYTRQVELLALCLRSGVAPRMLLYFRSSAKLTGELQFDVRSRVTTPPWWSWVRSDDKLKVLGQRFWIPPSLWQPGFIYSYVVDLRRRPGREHYFGAWFSLDGSEAPRAIEREDPIPLLVLP